ncbi:Hypothetical predicted protein [Podarcis lilfordi]|uniref:Uncharacterized protein n=1 Tax=Podarcis lilfordi TaxID=74358 RepID=A0AA35NZZ6_9SAUR|nr:Hypothetical predicted protein [Podarcis lilfordi]
MAAVTICRRGKIFRLIHWLQIWRYDETKHYLQRIRHSNMVQKIMEGSLSRLSDGDINQVSRGHKKPESSRTARQKTPLPFTERMWLEVSLKEIHPVVVSRILARLVFESHP